MNQTPETAAIHPPLRVLSFGAGAIGTYIGGSLALQGHPVVFLEKPEIVARLRKLAPHSQVVLHSLGPDYNYVAALESGELDAVIGNWPQPPQGLHMAKLFEDEVVCLVSPKHPAVRRGWDQDAWLAAEHIAPMATHPGARGLSAAKRTGWPSK